MSSVTEAEVEVQPAGNHRDIFVRLAAPFADVKQRQGGGGRMLSYITARQAMNRLDEVVGPDNWEDDYFEVHNVLFCRLSIVLPDGRTVTKCGSGGFKEMTEKGAVDQENTDKTGESDAFKRAAVKFGVARYLYNDGMPAYAEEAYGNRPAAPAPRQAPAQAPRQQAAPQRPAPAPAAAPGPPREVPDTASQLDPEVYLRVPQNPRGVFPWVKSLEEKYHVGVLQPLNGWAKEQGFPWKTAEYDADQLDAAIGFVVDLLDQHLGVPAGNG